MASAAGVDVHDVLERAARVQNVPMTYSGAGCGHIDHEKQLLVLKQLCRRSSSARFCKSRATRLSAALPSAALNASKNEQSNTKATGPLVFRLSKATNPSAPKLSTKRLADQVAGAGRRCRGQGVWSRQISLRDHSHGQRRCPPRREAAPRTLSRAQVVAAAGAHGLEPAPT